MGSAIYDGILEGRGEVKVISTVPTRESTSVNSYRFTNKYRSGISSEKETKGVSPTFTDTALPDLKTTETISKVVFNPSAGKPFILQGSFPK